MIEHAISAIRRKNRREDGEKIYRMYVTDVLKGIAENTAEMAGYKVSLPRYIEFSEEILGGDKPKKKDTPTAEQIISNMKKKLDSLGS